MSVQVHHGSFAPGRLSLDRGEALRYLGHAGQPVDEGLMGRFEALAAACESGTRALWAWVALPCRRVDGGMAVDMQGAGAAASGVVADAGGTSLLLPGKDLAAHVDGAGEVVLMACTLGAECDREARRLSALSGVDGMLYGACAGALVEASADALEGVVRAEVEAGGMALTGRFSPGYGDLPLDVQPALLAALDAQRRMGLHVNDDGWLVPSKSVTAVMGVVG